MLDARVNLLTVGVYRDSKIASHAIMPDSAARVGDARGRLGQNSAESAAIITRQRPLLLRVNSSKRLSSVRTLPRGPPPGNWRNAQRNDRENQSERARVARTVPSRRMKRNDGTAFNPSVH